MYLKEQCPKNYRGLSMKLNNNAPFEDVTNGESHIFFYVGFGLASCAFLMLMATGIGVRFEIWHFRTGFTLLKYAAYGGILAVFVILVAIVLAATRRQKINFITVFAAGIMAIPSFAVPYYWQWSARQLPRIHDISTDLDNPPRFVAILPLRKGSANQVEYGGAEVAAKQRDAYPDLKTMVLDIPADKAFAQALAAVHRLHWEIVAEVPAEGRIEATDTTFWFGFKDDIVIRVTSAVNQTRIDVRSLSRVGISDVGTNARRVRAYLSMLSSLSS
jgi:uncharacterized protein (DUF1499 family)